MEVEEFSEVGFSKEEGVLMWSRLWYHPSLQRVTQGPCQAIYILL
jgi:hypothetical protein